MVYYIIYDFLQDFSVAMRRRLATAVAMRRRLATAVEMRKRLERYTSN